MPATHVRIRAFREQRSMYLASDSPVAITRCDEVISDYWPAQPRPRVSDFTALGNAAVPLE